MQDLSVGVCKYTAFILRVNEGASEQERESSGGRAG